MDSHHMQNISIIMKTLRIKTSETQFRPIPINKYEQ